MTIITEKDITQTLLKTEIEAAAILVKAAGVTPDYSFLTREMYRRAGLLEKYNEFKCSGCGGSFMSTLPN